MEKRERTDRRLALGRTMLEAGKLESFADLMTIITISLMREALGNENHKSMTTKVFNPQKFTIEDLVDLAEMIDCDPNLLLQLALKEYLRNRGNKGTDEAR